jgi:hypothetical protein
MCRRYMEEEFQIHIESKNQKLRAHLYMERHWIKRQTMPKSIKVHHAITEKNGQHMCHIKARFHFFHNIHIS